MSCGGLEGRRMERVMVGRVVGWWDCYTALSASAFS